MRRKDQEERLIEKTLPLEKDNTPEKSKDQLEKDFAAPEKRNVCWANKKHQIDIRRFCEKRMSKGNSSPSTPAAESTESNDISMKKATRGK